MGNKVTDIERDKRVEEVAVMLATGATRQNIIQHITNNGWGIETRQIDHYIKKAKDYLANEADDTRANIKMEFAKSLRRLNMIFTKCMQVQDYQRALAAQREINSLLALYEPVKEDEKTLRVIFEYADSDDIEND